MEEVGAEGNINVGVSNTPVVISEYLEIVQQSILNLIRPGYNRYYGLSNDTIILGFINNLLKESQAIIAGGYLLHAIHASAYQVANYESPDIDIYVPCKHLVKFNKVMAQLTDIRVLRQHNATFYCLSFLRRNGIRSVQSFYKASDRGGRIGKHMMDIMAVRNSRSPLDVVQNFDLTFCQVWYDGESVWGTHPQDIKNRSGVLQKDYVKLYLEGNLFLRRRLQKYSRRGYKIILDKTVLPTIYTLTLTGNMHSACPTLEKTETYYRKWVSRALFKFIFYATYTVDTKTIQDSGKIAMNRSTHINEIYELFTETMLNLPANQMKPIEITDGYDSDEYDIETPSNYYPILSKYSLQQIPTQFVNDWRALSDEEKFWNILRILVNMFFSTSKFKNPIKSYDYFRGDNTISMNDIYRLFENTPSNKFAPYATALLTYTARTGSDAITLDDDVKVYDLHSHTLDQAISVPGFKSYLDTMMNVVDKTNIHCYIDTCQWNLSLDEIAAIVDKDYYMRFTADPPLPPPDQLLGTQGLGDNPGNAETKLDLLELIQNAPSDAGGWLNIYHHVMCPFCLNYISRDAGCTYVTHPNPRNLPRSFAPFCKEQNIIKDVRNKYANIFGNPYLEICAECGRPCISHKHFDLNDPPGLAPQLLTARGDPDYSRCSGGGRVELIARIMAVNKISKTNPDMDAKDLRAIAAFAADEAPNDPALLAKATQILAKERTSRSEANLNNSSNDLGNNPLDAIVVEGGKRRVGKVCPHGFETYKAKIKKTRRVRGKKSKGTKKN